MTHNVTAVCERHGEFQVQRKTVRKKSTSGEIYTIENLVCPNCRCWAKVSKIEEVE